MTAAQPLLSEERERFIDDLIGYMTLEEKLGQLDLAHAPHDPGLEAAIAAGRIGGVAGPEAPQRLQTLATEHSRLGIPLLIAVAPAGLPLSPWAMAASWDEDLAYKMGIAAADEAARRGANCLLGPDLVVAAGPVPVTTLAATSQAHLAARLSEAFARGAARCEGGSRPRALAILPIAGPEVATLRCSLDLVYRGAVLALDCAALDRETALKADFTGLMAGECRRLMAILAEHFATTSARSPIEAAEKAIADGLVGEHEIDSAVRGVLAVKHALGLFRLGGGMTSRLAANDEQPSRADFTRRAMVLLRNESGILPLSPVSDRVLVVGTAEGAGGACADALSRAGIGYAMAPGLALRRAGEASTAPVAGDHFAQSLTRDAAQRADFVLVTLEDRHFIARGNSPWRQPGRAILSLLDALATTRSRLVALVATDEPVDLAEADQHFSAVLQCWNPGPGFEEALADILSGRHSPQGRLPVTAGRFEFGQGLGYGESVFSALTLSHRSDHLAASVRVRNSGSFAARETVQIYVRDADGGLRLVGFEHVTLAPGEDAPVHFELRLEALGEVGADRRLELGPGSHEILVGKHIGRLLSARIDLSPVQVRAIRRQDVSRLRLATG